MLFVLSAVLSFSACENNKSIDIVTVTDIHLAGREYHDYEGFFLEANDTNGSGKQMRYLDDIFDAFISEMLERKPEYIIITGDSTFTGAKESHEVLTEKLLPLVDAGITVLVLPGNHDIENPTFIYLDGEYQQTETLTPEEYRETYSAFGYSGGISYHEDSLSYVYDTGKGVRIFMLDTNMAYGVLYGDFGGTKLEWLEKELDKCKKAGDIPLVAGHHTLLEHNKMFNFGYRLGNSEDVEKLLTESGCTLYLCGHMHTQHIAENENITDIVGGSFAVYPHRYGVIEFSKDGWNYESVATDVETYAKNIGSENPDLLGYSEYGYAYFYDNAYAQAKESLSYLITDKDLLEKYSDFSAKVNVAYFGGTFSEIDLSPTEEFLKASEGIGWGGYIGTILSDTDDHVKCSRTFDE